MMKNEMNTEAHQRAFRLMKLMHSVSTDLMRDMMDSMSGWQEITSPLVGDIVALSPDYDDILDSGYGKIIYAHDDGEYTIVTLDDELLMLTANEFEVVRDGEKVLPNFCEMWNLKTHAIREWLFDGDGVRIMTELGFRIYYHKSHGFWAGVEVGKEFNIIKDYWMPLNEMVGKTWGEMPEKYMRNKSLMRMINMQCNILDTLPGTDIHHYEVCLKREDTNVSMFMEWWSTEEPDLAVCLHSLVRDARNYELYHDDFLLFESQYEADSIKELAAIFEAAEYHYAQLIEWCKNQKEYDWLINIVLS